MQNTKSMICATFPGNDPINELWINCLELDRGSDEMYHRAPWSITSSTEFIKPPRKYLRSLVSAPRNPPDLDCRDNENPALGKLAIGVIERSPWNSAKSNDLWKESRFPAGDRWSPLESYRREHLSCARGTKRGKKVQLALPAMRLSYFSFSLSLRISAVMQPTGNEILFPVCKAGRSLRTLCLWSTRLIWFFRPIKRGLTRVKRLMQTARRL